MTDNSAASAQSVSDYVNGTTIFSEMNQAVFSKTFKGGKITNVFGSTELDFTNADIDGVAVLEISQLFGETTILVPANWRIDTNISQFCAELDDQRLNQFQKNTGKVLVINGLSFFAAIDIITI